MNCLSRCLSILTARILIRLIFALRFAVAEQLLVDTLAVAARQLSIRTDRLVGLQERQHFSRL